MDWADQGIVLSVRRHGETSAIVNLLTHDHGRHAGVVRGGQSRRLRGVLQPGNLVSAVWRARLEEHLGTYTLELERSLAAPLLDYPDRLAALNACCALLDVVLAEREVHQYLFASTLKLITELDGQDWPPIFVQWELALLSELGFGLDLFTCAATGSNDDLAYVSPKTGRAVSLSAGAEYRDKLLPLPPFLTSEAKADAKDIIDGLTLTGYFFHKYIFQPFSKTEPQPRSRVVEILRRKISA